MGSRTCSAETPGETSSFISDDGGDDDGEDNNGAHDVNDEEDCDSSHRFRIRY